MHLLSNSDIDRMRNKVNFWVDFIWFEFSGFLLLDWFLYPGYWTQFDLQRVPLTNSRFCKQSKFSVTLYRQSNYRNMKILKKAIN